MSLGKYEFIGNKNPIFMPLCPIFVGSVDNLSVYNLYSSERVDSTGATGDRLKEGAGIIEIF